MTTKFWRLFASAALSTCLAGAASAACPVTGEEMDMVIAGAGAPCFAETPAAGISPAGGGAATPTGTARSTPTNFQFTGTSAAFTTFGNFAGIAGQPAP